MNVLAELRALIKMKLTQGENLERWHQEVLSPQGIPLPADTLEGFRCAMRQVIDMIDYLERKQNENKIKG